MSATLGRITTGFGISAWQPQGEQVRVSGIVSSAYGATTVTIAKEVRAQLLGLADPFGDEPVIPVTWSDDSTADGYYRVLDVNVGSDPASLAVPYFTFDLTLERVRAAAIARIESRVVGAIRTNDPGIGASGTDGWYAVPDDAIDFDDGGEASDTVQRTTDTGVVTVYIAAGHTSPALSFLGQYAVAPADFYDGAPKIRAGSDLWTVVGRQMPNDPVNWMLDNGLVRIRGVTGGKVGTYRYNGTTLSARKDWIFHYTDAGAATASGIGSVVALRNDAEACGVRLVLVISDTWSPGLPDKKVVVDLVLARGSRFVEGTITGTESHKWKFMRDTVEAATALGSGMGIVATAADADSNKYLLLSPDDHADDVTNGGVSLTSAGTRLQFAVGYQHSATPGSFEDAAGIVSQYLDARSATLRVVDQ